MSFSAHADAKGIMQLIRMAEPRNMLLVHGEAAKMEFLKGKIEQEFSECDLIWWDVSINWSLGQAVHNFNIIAPREYTNLWINTFVVVYPQGDLRENLTVIFYEFHLKFINLVSSFSWTHLKNDWVCNFLAGIDCYMPANGETATVTTNPSVPVDISLNLLKREMALRGEWSLAKEFFLRSPSLWILFSPQWLKVNWETVQ